MRSVLPAIGLWIVYVLVFAIAGGLATGVMAWLFEAIVKEPFTDPFYSVCFGATGFIAYKLAAGVVEERARMARYRSSPASTSRPLDTGKPLV